MPDTECHCATVCDENEKYFASYIIRSVNRQLVFRKRSITTRLVYIEGTGKLLLPVLLSGRNQISHGQRRCFGSALVLLLGLIRETNK